MGWVLLDGRWRPASAAQELLARTYHRDKDGKFSSGGGGIRESLAAADTPQAVAGVLTSELHRVTGRDVAVDFTGADVAVARGYAEGILRGQERFPAAPLTRVMMSEYTPFAEATRDMDAPRSGDGTGAILFNPHVSSSPEAFEAALTDLRTENLAMAGTNPTWVGLHEMAHVVNNYSTPGKDWPHRDFASRETTRVVKEQMQSEGLDGSTRQGRQDYVERAMSAKAAQTENELVSEAVADSMLSGDGASPLSRRIDSALEADYRSAQSGQTGARVRGPLPLAAAAGASWPPCDRSKGAA